MPRHLIVIAAVAALAAAPSAAKEQADLPKPEKLICKMVGDTQWRTSRSRVCKSKAQWDAITRETQKEFRDYGRTGSQGDLNGD